MTPMLNLLLLICLVPLPIIVISRRIDIVRKNSLKAQAGSTVIHGNAAHSLQNEKMRIRKTNRDKGIIGELGVAKDLEYLASEYGLTVLHDLSIPGSKANIDHILISRKVVYVIDAKNYTGVVKVSPNKDGIKKLRVGGRDQTALVAKLKKYSDTVSKFLASENIEVKVVPVLAFYQAKFDEDSAVTIDGVTVNIFGIENELLRYANLKVREFDIDAIAGLLLRGFPLKS